MFALGYLTSERISKRTADEFGSDFDELLQGNTSSYGTGAYADTMDTLGEMNFLDMDEPNEHGDYNYLISEFINVSRKCTLIVFVVI